MSITNITSPTHLSKLLSASTYVVADFYADWCGPCKAIAPIFSQLATSETKPGRMAFVKVDVDGQQAIARTYGVTAMPTFLIFKNGKVVNTLRGADPSALRTAVLSAASDAAKNPAKTSAAYSSQGHVLGNNEPTTKVTNASAGFSLGRSARTLLTGGLLYIVVRFVMLYLTSLFSLDPREAAENSAYNVRNNRKTK